MRRNVSTNQTHAAHLPSGDLSNSVDGAEKKGLTNESFELHAISLCFESRELERQWRWRNISRQRLLATRYLLMCSLFQLAFHVSDSIEVAHAHGHVLYYGIVITRLRMLLAAGQAETYLFFVLFCIRMGLLFTRA